MKSKEVQAFNKHTLRHGVNEANNHQKSRLTTVISGIPAEIIYDINECVC